jgi:hypothetical protein
MAIEQREGDSGSTEGRRLMYVFIFAMAWGVWHPKLIPSCVSVEATRASIASSAEPGSHCTTAHPRPLRANV